VGLAQLAMHSSYETAGVADTGHLMRALKAFYEADIHIDGADAFTY
jgi:aspartyl aminopeptidase